MPPHAPNASAAIINSVIWIESLFERIVFCSPIVAICAAWPLPVPEKSKTDAPLLDRTET